MNQVILKLRSRKLTQVNEVCVLLPENDYACRRTWPVLWLLHGAGGDYTSFLYHDHLETLLRDRHCMAVMPSGLNSDFANHMEFANGYPMTDYFFEELMPWIFRCFPASEKPEDNYLAGYSMGGAAALMFALLHPEKFVRTGVLGSSVRESEFLRPYLDLTGPEFRALALADPTRFPTEFGDPARGITRKEINMIARYDRVSDYVDGPECTWERFRDAAAAGRVPDLLFCCGERDGCFEKVQAFRRYAEGLGQTGIRYDFVPGCGHAGSDAVLKRALDLMELP